MPRYFFNIHNDEGVDLHDDVGVPLDSRADIRKHMMSMAIDLADGMNWQDQPWLIEVLDESGKIVCVMDIGIEREPATRSFASGTIRDIHKGGLQTMRSLMPSCSEFVGPRPSKPKAVNEDHRGKATPKTVERKGNLP